MIALSTSSSREGHSANRRVELLFSCTAFMFGAALPTSSFLLNVALVLVVVCLLLGKNTQHVRALIVHPLVWLPALMFLLLALSLLYQNNAYGIGMVGKYKKLLFILPIALFFLYNRHLITQFCTGFLIANAVVLVVSVLVGVLSVPVGNIDPGNPTVFKLHITQNFFMALAALFWLALAFNRSGWLRWGYAVLALLACYSVLFLVLGRTGYVAFIVGLGVWLFLSLKNWQRLGLMALALIAVCLLIMVPNRASDRMMLGLKEIRGCLTVVTGNSYESCNNSMGQRTAFAIESLRLIKQAPFLGNGAGSFYYSNPQTGYSIHNPHNEYLLEAVHSGLIGLLTFLVWIACCYRIAWRQPGVVRNILLAVLSSYMACNLFNSFLLDSSEGNLFMALVAILTVYSLSDRLKTK